jgi:hypothetical protein
MNSILVQGALARCAGRRSPLLATLRPVRGGAPTQNPRSHGAPVADYTGPRRDGRRAGVQASTSGRTSSRTAAAARATRHRPGAALRAHRRREPRLPGGQHLVNLTRLISRSLVTKVGGGHNCWLSQNSACADIHDRLGPQLGGLGLGGKQIALKAPPIKDVGRARPSRHRFRRCSPAPSIRLVRQYCARCHSVDGRHAAVAVLRRSPTSTRPTPRRAPRSTSTRSRQFAPRGAPARGVPQLLEQRLRGQRPTRCRPRSRPSRTASRSPVTRTLVVSKALTLYDGTVASGGNRFDTSQIALWEFKTGMGTVAFDTSGVEPGDQPERSPATSAGWAAGASTSSRRQGPGLDHRQQQARRPDQGHRRVLDRGLGRAGQRHAGGRASSATRAAPRPATSRSAQREYNYEASEPQQQDDGEWRAGAAHRRRRRDACRPRCSTWS